jgi:hypothetical protein
MATAAALLGLLAVLYIVPPALSQLGRESNWLWALYAIPLLIVPFALLIPAVMRPRSVVAAMAAALVVGGLVIWGMSVQPISWPRLIIHVAAILCLAALALRVIPGIVDRDFRVLWIVPALLLGFPIGYLAAGMMGLHVVTQVCHWPPLGAEISLILCSG